MITDKELQVLLQQAQALLDNIPLSDINDEIAAKEQLTFQPDFWDKSESKKIVKDLALLKDQQTTYNQLSSLTDDVQTYHSLLKEESNPDTLAQLSTELNTAITILQARIKNIKLEQYLSGKYDSLGAIVSIHSGQGGVEAMDWAEMLKRMYARYFERKGWKAKLSGESKGDEAGIKSAEFEVKAKFAYGFLKHEQGAHRLVRLSPFNADNLRQTSFALVEVIPLLDENDGILELPSSDLIWNFSRSGGAGGQSVNKTSSAVELTHKPTGLVVKCREERSQVQNKQKALKKLKGKLAQQEAEKLSKELANEKGAHVNASWGNQIRNYVLHPYKLVKDTRTLIETSNTEAVLDGDIENFIQEEIKL